MATETLLFLQACSLSRYTWFSSTIAPISVQFIERKWTLSGSGSIICCVRREWW